MIHQAEIATFAGGHCVCLASVYDQIADAEAPRGEPEQPRKVAA